MAKRAPKKSDGGPIAFTGDEKVAVFFGAETFLQTEYTDQLRKAIHEKYGEAETFRFDGDSASLSDVLDELRSFGLMQQHKIVIVANADGFISNHREPLERYVAEPVDSATLILRAKSFPSNTKLYKAIDQSGVNLKCEPVTEPAAAKWLVDRAKSQYGIRLSPQGAGKLVEFLGASLGLLDSELGKLAVGLKPDELMPEQRIDALTGRASDEKIWAIQDALLGGRTRAALETVHELTDLAGHDAVPVMWFVSDLMRKLHQAATLQASGLNAFETGKQMKIWPREKAAAITSAAKKLGVRKCAGLMARSIELDRRSKSGFGEGVRNLERFCVHFAEALR